MVLTIFLLPLAYSYGFSEKGQECSRCHKMSREEAIEVLKGLDQKVNVLEVRKSPVVGLWEVVIETEGKKVPLYIDFSKRHLISGAIVAIKEKRNLSRERFTELNKVDVSKIPLSDALVMGDKNAKHRVIVFDDPD